MTDQHCRVTVVGERRRVNLAVPAQAPIVDYVATLADLCGQPTDDSFPAVWSLAVVGRAPFPLERSLAACGVVDGQVLQLRDVLAGEADEAVVLDVDEAVEDASQRFGRWAWTPRAHSATQLLLAAAWLVCALVALEVGAPRVDPRSLAGPAILLGVIGVAIAAVASHRKWPMPGPVRGLLAFATVPEFGAAGAFLAGRHATHGVVALAVMGGALLGSAMAMAAVPGTATLAISCVVAVGFAAAALLSALHADAAESAAVIVVVALVLSSLAPWSVGWLVVHSPFERALDAADLEVTANHVQRAWMLLAAWNAVLGLVEAVSLVWLAGSAGTSAMVLVGCASLALVLGAGASRQLIDVLPGLAAGAAGLLALSLEAPGRLHQPLWLGPVLALGLGFCLMLAGLVGTLPGRRPLKRPRFFSPLAGLLRLLSVPAAVGVFGVLDHLSELGHHL